MRKAAYIFVGLILFGSLSLNLYHYGYRLIYQKGFNAGVTMISNAVTKEYKDTGRITAMMDGKSIVFVPEKLVEIPKLDEVEKMFQ